MRERIISVGFDASTEAPKRLSIRRDLQFREADTASQRCAKTSRGERRNASVTQLIEAEARRAERLAHPNSLDMYFQGVAWFNKGLTPGHMAQARAVFERALVLDPKNIVAMVWMATVDMVVGSTWMSDNRGAILVAAEETLTKALSLAPNHAWAYVVLGHVLVSTNRAPLCIAECERASALDRNLAKAHALLGLAKFCMGRGAETEAHMRIKCVSEPRYDLVLYIE